MVGLVDCNNFFVSCERVFNPALEGVPVVVLSGNDGGVIARINEAKAMGIAMGEPFFKIRSLYKDGTLKVCSSNIRLYGDMSKRVMGILRSKTVKTEVYSIDEAFISLEGIPEPADYCRNLVKTIRRSTGIPVSIGIANTKTLAKMASKFAKQYPGYKGCCTIDSDERRTKALKLFPIGNVWGIGRQNKKALNLRGVSTAYDFTLWSEQKVRELLGITGVATWRELQGLRCTLESITANFHHWLQTLPQLWPNACAATAAGPDESKFTYVPTALATWRTSTPTLPPQGSKYLPTTRAKP